MFFDSTRPIQNSASVDVCTEMVHCASHPDKPLAVQAASSAAAAWPRTGSQGAAPAASAPGALAVPRPGAPVGHPGARHPSGGEGAAQGPARALAPPAGPATLSSIRIPQGAPRGPVPAPAAAPKVSYIHILWQASLKQVSSQPYSGLYLGVAGCLHVPPSAGHL